MAVPMFRGLPDEIIASICGILELTVAVKGQDVFQQGSTGKEMHILIQGELEVSKDNEGLGFLSEGAFFGEVPLLSNDTGAEVRTHHPTPT